MIYRTDDQAVFLQENPGTKCWQCSEPLAPPFVIWNGGEATIALCPDCAQYLCRGLASDVYEIRTGDNISLGGKGKPGANHAKALFWNAAAHMVRFPAFYQLENEPSRER